MKKKILLLILTLTLIFTMCACTPNAKISDIYVNHPELTEFDGAKEEGTLPKDIKVAYGFSGNRSPFFVTRSWVVVKKGSNEYGVYDYKNNKWIVGEDKLAYYVNKNENFIIYQKESGGELKVVNCENLKEFSLKDYGVLYTRDIIIPSEGSKLLFAVKDKTYMIFNKDGYLTKINQYVDSSYLNTIEVFDNYIIQSNKTVNSVNGAITDASIACLYKITNERDNEETITLPKEIFSAYNVYPSYIGNGKFYVFIQDRAYDNEFDYQVGTTKYTGLVKIYNIETKKVEKEFKDDKYYKYILSNENEQISNAYGDLTVSINEVIKKGYKFVSSGFSINKSTKMAEVDQFVVNDNFDVIISLSGKYGADIKLNNDRLVGLSPLMLIFIDGKGFSPNTDWSNIRMINIDGTTAFEKYDGLYKNLFYNNDSLVCQKVIASDKNIIETSQKVKFGAFDRNGKQIVDFKYDYMTPFINGYAFATDTYIKDKQGNEIKYFDIYSETKNNIKTWFRPDGTAFEEDFNPQSEKKIYKFFRVDKLGNAVPIKDVAKTRKNDRLIFKLGAYVSSNDNGTYNVKSISGKKLFNEDFTDVVIDKPNLDDVTICGTKDNVVHIYTLVSSTRGVPKARTINDVIIPSVIVGTLLIVGVVMVVVIKLKKPQIKEEVKEEQPQQPKNKKKKK